MRGAAGRDVSAITSSKTRVRNTANPSGFQPATSTDKPPRKAGSADGSNVTPSVASPSGPIVRGKGPSRIQSQLVSTRPITTAARPGLWKWIDADAG